MAFASIRPEGSLMPEPMIEREEHNTDTPFGQFREKSSQRIIYTGKTSHLVTELNYRHVLFKDFLGKAPDRHHLYQASFKGFNLSSPLEFRAGRIGAGNNNMQAVDGVSWYYPWGKRLYTTVDLGQVANIDGEQKNRPSFAEGRLHYRFNEQAFMAVKAVNRHDDTSGAVMVGYNGDELLITGEAMGGGATDTMHLSMHYIADRKFDYSADYLINHGDNTDSGLMRNCIGLETGEMYVEAMAGSTFWFNGPDIPDNRFYEGSLTWGRPSSNNVSAGYLVETTPATSSRTIFARAQRKVSAKTTLSLGVDNTRFENQAGSVQNLEGRIRRKVNWGYFEVSTALITGGSDADLQKDIRLRAGYNF